MSNNIVNICFDASNSTLYISGAGELHWSQTVMFREVTKHVVIEGDGIYSNNMSNLFSNFENLVDIEGTIDTSKCRDFSYLYSGCRNLIKPIVGLDTSSGEEFDFFHNDNHALTSTAFNTTDSGYKFLKMFQHCDSLVDIQGVKIPQGYSIETISDNPFIIGLLGGSFKENVANG